MEKLKILIVEDDIVSGSILSKILSKQSHDVDHGRDGMQALEMYQTGNCRLVVSDWMMPKLDGIALCRRIRELNRSDYAYIIMITGKKAKEDFLSRIRAGQRILELQDVYGHASAKLAHSEKLPPSVRLRPESRMKSTIRPDRNYRKRVEIFRASG